MILEQAGPYGLVLLAVLGAGLIAVAVVANQVRSGRTRAVPLLFGAPVIALVLGAGGSLVGVAAAESMVAEGPADLVAAAAAEGYAAALTSHLLGTSVAWWLVLFAAWGLGLGSWLARRDRAAVRPGGLGRWVGWAGLAIGVCGSAAAGVLADGGPFHMAAVGLAFVYLAGPLGLVGHDTGDQEPPSADLRAALAGCCLVAVALLLTSGHTAGLIMTYQAASLASEETRTILMMSGSTVSQASFVLLPVGLVQAGVLAGLVLWPARDRLRDQPAMLSLAGALITAGVCLAAAGLVRQAGQALVDLV